MNVGDSKCLKPSILGCPLMITNVFKKITAATMSYSVSILAWHIPSLVWLFKLTDFFHEIPNVPGD